MTEKQKSTLAVVLMSAVAILLQILGFLFGEERITEKLLNALLIVGLIAGLIYVRYGFRKSAAIYYKTFMLIYAAESIYSVVAGILYDQATKEELSHGLQVLNTVCAVVFSVAALLVVLLALVKNLRKKPSLILAGFNMGIVFVFTLVQIIAFQDFTQFYGIYIGSVILSIIAYIFVEDKYADKDARGAK